MTTPVDDAILGLHAAAGRAAHMARGTGRRRAMEHELNVAIGQLTNLLKGRTPIDTSDPWAVVEAHLEAGGDIDELIAAAQQRRTMDSLERQTG